MPLLRRHRWMELRAAARRLARRMAGVDRELPLPAFRGSWEASRLCR